MTGLIVLLTLGKGPLGGLTVTDRIYRVGEVDRYRTLVTLGGNPMIEFLIANRFTVKSVDKDQRATVIVQIEKMEVAVNGDKKDEASIEPTQEIWGRRQSKLSNSPRLPGSLDMFAFADLLPDNGYIEGSGSHVKRQVATNPNGYFEGDWTCIDSSDDLLQLRLKGALINMNLRPVGMTYDVTYNRRSGKVLRVSMASECWVDQDSGRLTVHRQTPVHLQMEMIKNL
ncbi:MAG: hypothetical protein BGO01_12145 [Armatimonadetes bacterium 55-13]|nr:hypothetical protein [Armatimonadota bacterium]OJU63538.1 MAG: hypothetical protein BGO01_12145 [Armatimonadetes bacterium 55-13]